MVNSTIVSQFQGPPNPPKGGGSRKIPGGPLYPVAQVVVLLESADIRLWTKKCIQDAQKLAFDTDDIKQLMQSAFTEGRYIDSEWTVQSSRAGAPWAACDAYSYQRDEWIANAGRNMKVEYYLKFSIAKSGKVILTVSCHT